MSHRCITKRHSQLWSLKIKRRRIKKNQFKDKRRISRKVCRPSRTSIRRRILLELLRDMFSWQLPRGKYRSPRRRRALRRCQMRRSSTSSESKKEAMPRKQRMEKRLWIMHSSLKRRTTVSRNEMKGNCCCVWVRGTRKLLRQLMSLTAPSTWWSHSKCLRNLKSSFRR